VASTRGGYRWAAWGDLNASFGLLLDNLTNLVLLWGLLSLAGFPADIYFGLMVPGTALGVMVGDLVYTWLAFRLARKTGNREVTAMPLGLDTPSTIGVAVAVLIPCFLAAKEEGLSAHDAGMVAWGVGMATLVFMGIVKTAASFVGEWIQRVVPQAGLLGSLAGVGITLLGFLPFKHVYHMPVVGLVALGLLLYTTVAKIRLPGDLPGAFVAVAAGTAVYYLMGLTGTLGAPFQLPSGSLHLSPPLPTLAWLDQAGAALKYLPFAIPFGLLTIVGGINVTESARCAGDDFKTRDILLTEAAATIVAGLCGGVVQSTPYIGHPAYKAMGGRAAYTLACGLAVGLGGALGLVSWVVEAIPAPAVAPLLMFVGLEITGQAYEVCPKRHYPAIFMALLPVLGELVRIALCTLLFDPGMGGRWPAGEDARSLFDVSVVLGHGFIITSMLWAAALALLIDRKIVTSTFYFAIMALLCLFGFIHSMAPNGDIYLPWTLGEAAASVYRLTLAYLIAGGLLLLLWLVTPRAAADVPAGD
jgi:AGZA family xanthine/uracil permease-like MFS transporter